MQTLKKGSSGKDVEYLQSLLAERGYGIAADGIFGKATEEAVRKEQEKGGISADGIVGQRTWELLTGSGEAPWRLSTGDYVWFLNAGDELRSEDTVSRMLEVACGGEGEGEWPDVIYGETVITDMDGNEIGTRRLETPEELNADSFKRGMLVCHQAFVAKMAICEEYDTQYRLSADFEWCLSILERSKRTVNSRMTLVRFLDGGITKHNIPTALRERFKIMCKHYGVLSTVWHHIPIAAKFVWYVVRKGRFGG